MIRFILFIRKISFFLLFVLLEVVAIHYYANSTSYTKAKMVTASNYVVGGIYSQLSGVNDYFHLKAENLSLSEEVAALRNQLDTYKHSGHDDSLVVLRAEDSLLFYPSSGKRKFEYYTAKVVNNSLIHQENFITLNRGAEEGLEPNMAVIADHGIVGYVLSCSEHFSVCISILNTKFRTSGRIKGEEFFGSVLWDGTSFEYVTLTEMPKYAPVEVGDTVVTTDYSSIFPADIFIGTVEEFELKNATYYDVKVKLHTNMAALNNVLVIKNLEGAEKEILESSVLPVAGAGVH